MAWLSQFLLGRPGLEFSFDFNPEAMTIDEGPLAVYHRNLAGDMKKSVIKNIIPVIKINSSFLTLAQRNQFASLAAISDTFLSFQTRDDWQVIAERNLPSDTTHVTIQNNSITRLSAALVAAGASGIITINSVTTAPYTGTNYFTGGSYADATRIVTLGSALSSSTNPVYVTYTYKGWLVNMEKLSHAINGGWVDRFTYDFVLTGA
jgi:hypothetical protein